MASGTTETSCKTLHNILHTEHLSDYYAKTDKDGDGNPAQADTLSTLIGRVV